MATEQPMIIDPAKEKLKRAPPLQDWPYSNRSAHPFMEHAEGCLLYGEAGVLASRGQV